MRQFLGWPQVHGRLFHFVKRRWWRYLKSVVIFSIIAHLINWFLQKVFYFVSQRDAPYLGREGLQLLDEPAFKAITDDEEFPDSKTERLLSRDLISSSTQPDRKNASWSWWNSIGLSLIWELMRSDDLFKSNMRSRRYEVSVEPHSRFQSRLQDRRFKKEKLGW